MGRNLKTALGLGLCIAALAGSLSTSRADVLHYHNGKVLQCKISRLTGELIEIKTHSGWDKEMVQRLSLTNRRDVVETQDHKKYFGEILYMDKFTIEIETATGRNRINRLLVSNVVLGSPLQQPMSDFMESLPQQTAKPSEANIKPVSHTPSATASTNKPTVQFPVDINEENTSPATLNSTNSANTVPQGRINPPEDEDAIPDERTP